MANITDEYMQQMLATVESYCIALLKPTGTIPENFQQIL